MPQMDANSKGPTSCLVCLQKKTQNKIMPIIYFPSVIRDCVSVLCQSKRTVRGLAS